MGAEVGNIRLAGDAAARQRAAASEGIKMRREAAARRNSYAPSPERGYPGSNTMNRMEPGL